MLANQNCRIGIEEFVFLHKNWFQSISAMFMESFWSSRWGILSESSLSNSVSRSWYTFFEKSCLTPSLQVFNCCSNKINPFDELITRWTTIGSEESVDIRDIANMSNLKWKPYSIRVFPDTPPRKLPNRRSVYNINIVQAKICLNNILRCCNIFRTNTSKVCWISPTSFFEE